jgi:hypothetical protein
MTIGALGDPNRQPTKDYDNRAFTNSPVIRPPPGGQRCDVRRAPTCGDHSGDAGSSKAEVLAGTLRRSQACGGPGQLQVRAPMPKWTNARGWMVHRQKARHWAGLVVALSASPTRLYVGGSGRDQRGRGPPLAKPIMQPTSSAGSEIHPRTGRPDAPPPARRRRLRSPCTGSDT